MANEQPPASLYRLIYSQIEEVGWEQSVALGRRSLLSQLSHRYFCNSNSSQSSRKKDKKGRTHILDITLPRDYPQSSPSISADVPYICELEWSKTSRLKDIVQKFNKHLEKLQEFWSTMDEIDRALWVVNPKQPSYAASCQQINLDARIPRSLPECRFLGPETIIEPMWRNWKKNGRYWKRDKMIDENLVSLLEFTFPKPPTTSSKDEERIDCGICYAQRLPVDDELGVNSGGSTDYTCENLRCGKAFHTVCLRDWLCSITTTRSFDVLFGNCPYCSDPVAVKTNNCK